MTCGWCLHGPAANSPMALMELHVEAPGEKGQRDGAPCDGEEDGFSFFRTPLVFITYPLFPCVRLFFAVWRCQGERAFLPPP